MIVNTVASLLKRTIHEIPCYEINNLWWIQILQYVAVFICDTGKLI